MLDPDLRRTWLFGPGADSAAHKAMLDSGADALIFDLEDFTPPIDAMKPATHSFPMCRGAEDMAVSRQLGLISWKAAARLILQQR
jgi:citrate lyase beta subunit